MPASKAVLDRVTSLGSRGGAAASTVSPCLVLRGANCGREGASSLSGGTVSTSLLNPAHQVFTKVTKTFRSQKSNRLKQHRQTTYFTYTLSYIHPTPPQIQTFRFNSPALGQIQNQF